MYFEPSQGHGLPHNPVAACVSSRPIGWTSKVSAEGDNDLVPYGYFQLGHSFLPTMMCSTKGLKGDGRSKDSSMNAQETGEFLYNVATYSLRDAMNVSSISWDREIDEKAEVGLEHAPLRLVKPLRVAAALIQFECKTIKVLHLPTNREENRNTIVFGEVGCVQIDESCMTDGLVGYDKVEQVSAL